MWARPSRPSSPRPSRVRKTRHEFRRSRFCRLRFGDSQGSVRESYRRGHDAESISIGDPSEPPSLRIVESDLRFCKDPARRRTELAPMWTGHDASERHQSALHRMTRTTATISQSVSLNHSPPSILAIASQWRGHRGRRGAQKPRYCPGGYETLYAHSILRLDGVVITGIVGVLSRPILR